MKDNVKCAQYVAVLKKEDLIFDKENHKLKYFYEPKPNSTRVDNPDWLGYEVRYHINADSLNEPKDYSVQKSDGVYRIITLGDSYTFGLFVKPEENYPKLLEKKLNNDLKCKGISSFEVINLGVDGYDINYIVERYNKR